MVVDMRGRKDRVTPQAAIALNADPATEFDQIMAIHDPKSAGTDAWIDIVNSDGSMAQACGNGTRCVVQALAAETGRKAFLFHTVAGLRSEGTRQRHDLGRYGKAAFRLGPDPARGGIPRHAAHRAADRADRCARAAFPSVASMGNPHAIFWVENDVWSYELDRFGPLLENHPIFPERANISIARIRSRQEMDLRTWERGAGLTLACGSAACAAAVNGARTGRTERMVTVNVPGGPLKIEWRERDDHVIMTGPAEWEWSGTVDPVTGIFARNEPESGDNGARAL